MSMIRLSTVVMESFNEVDDLALSAPDKPFPTLPNPKLKRLKKASATSFPQPLASIRVPKAPIMLIPPVSLEPSEIRTGSSDAMENKGFGEETKPVPELDPLFAYRSGEEMLGDPYVPEVEVNEGGKDKEEVIMEESEKEKNVKRRLSVEDEEEDPNTRRKKKGKSKKLEDPDGKPKESVRERKRLEKARKAELEHLHAESQRLLRETRDASFKPVLLIQKPISSVLEKIRLRKLEIFKSCNILGSLPSVVDADCPVRSDCNSDPANSQSDLKEADRNAKLAFDVGCKGTQQNLTNDTEADKSGSQLCNGGDKVLISQEASPLSYPPTSSLNINGGCNDNGVSSSSDHDVSSSEEESDKENIGPPASNAVSKDSSSKDCLAKAFLDDEAEEEDDSDCDLSRFRENEEENETDDEHEELDDLIATGFEEAPMDEEKRNELHQKWLEQQDAAETDNVLQRLKSGRRGLGKPGLVRGDNDNYDESDDDDDDDDDDGDDEAGCNNRSIDTSRQSFKKAKQMISHMFTDANDVYIPSDDEETEKNLIRHLVLKNNEEPSFISPVEDESSREFFGLIKKLNIVPSTKKRGKASAPLFDSFVLSGSSNSSSKSSFLNRACNSLPSSHKKGSVSVRTYIFGRDDSNSKSNVSTSENNPETAEKESISGKNSMKEKLSSQRKSSIIKGTMQAKSGSGASLFNILRQSSVQFDKKLESKNSVNESQAAAYKFSAFKLKRNSKMGPTT